jgi:hypothetical protein
MTSQPSIREHDTVVLSADIPEYRLVTGDTAVVVDIGHDAQGRTTGFVLEVFAADGTSLDVVSVGPDAIRPARSDEIPSVRRVATA